MRKMISFIFFLILSQSLVYGDSYFHLKKLFDLISEHSGWGDSPTNHICAFEEAKDLEKPKIVILCMGDQDPRIQDSCLKKEERLKTCGYHVSNSLVKNLADIKKIRKSSSSENHIFWVDSHGVVLPGANNQEHSWYLSSTRKYSPRHVIKGNDLLGHLRNEDESSPVILDSCHSGSCFTGSQRSKNICSSCLSHEETSVHYEESFSQYMTEILCDAAQECQAINRHDHDQSGSLDGIELHAAISELSGEKLHETRVRRSYFSKKRFHDFKNQCLRRPSSSRARFQEESVKNHDVLYCGMRESSSQRVMIKKGHGNKEERRVIPSPRERVEEMVYLNTNIGESSRLGSYPHLNLFDWEEDTQDIKEAIATILDSSLSSSVRDFSSKTGVFTPFDCQLNFVSHLIKLWKNHSQPSQSREGKQFDQEMKTNKKAKMKMKRKKRGLREQREELEISCDRNNCRLIKTTEISPDTSLVTTHILRPEIRKISMTLWSGTCLSKESQIIQGNGPWKRFSSPLFGESFQIPCYSQSTKK